MNNLSTLNHRIISRMPISSCVIPNFLPGLISNACSEAKLVTQASDEMIAMTVLTTIAAALQAKIDVELPIGKKSPVSIYGLTLAESGERKSTVENLFMQGIREFQKTELISYRTKIQEYEIENEIYEVNQKYLKKLMIDKKISKEEREGYQYEFSQNKKKWPVKPVYPKMIYEDSTTEALLFGLYSNLSNAYLGTSEGGVLLSSKSMNDTSKFNPIWSDDPLTVDRKSSESFVLSDSRLTINLMAQFSALLQYLNKNNHDSRGGGFWSRFLICAPNTTCGTRQIDGVIHSQDSLKLFKTRVIDFLEGITSTSEECERSVISFTSEAKVIWIDIANDIETNMLPGGRYFNAKDHASKLADNIARVAALMQCFEEPNSKEIQADTLWSAINICNFYSNEFLKIFNAPPQYIFDSQMLHQWLEQNKVNGLRYIGKTTLMRFGPRSLRKKAVLDAALDHLYESQYLNYLHAGRTLVIDLLPMYPLEQSRLNAEVFSS